MNGAVVIGHAITELEVREAPQPTIPEGECHDVLDAQFYTIKTLNGYCDVELRISHNGYYGGWLNTPTKIQAVPEASVQKA